MRSNSGKLPPIFRLLLSGLLLAYSCVGDASPVAAQVAGPGPAPATGPGTTSGGGISGRDVGIGVGVAIGIGILGILIQQAKSSSAASSSAVSSSAASSSAAYVAPIGGQSYSGLQPPGLRRAPANNGRGGLPPASERRFIADEVIVEFSANASAQAVQQIALRYGLTRLEVQNFPLIGVPLSRWRVGAGRSLRRVIGALQNERFIASAQPNYVFTLREQAPQGLAGKQNGGAQYVLGKLQVEEAHLLATGRGILVAVIDSTVDVSHPDLDSTIVKGFDALGGEDKPQEHGTEMAGAIASHGKLLGIAPGARLLVARAFDDTLGGARGTSFAIYKSIQWAADNRARVISMSFAGPDDPAMHRMLTAAFDKDIMLIAAAGNGGAAAAPAYPGADADVLAVTATDSNDQLLAQDNRGRYIAVAAPGADVLALVPDGAYRLTTGTSVAAAEVSGIAALMLERKSTLKPADIRNILTTTAKPLGPAGPLSGFGAGLVSAYRAVVAAGSGEQTKQ